METLKRFAVFSFTREELENYPTNKEVYIGDKQQFRLFIPTDSELYHEIKINGKNINIYQILENNAKKLPFQIKEVTDGYELLFILPKYVNNIQFDTVYFIIDRLNENYEIPLNDEYELQDFLLNFQEDETAKDCIVTTNPNNMIYFSGGESE